ncbi:hypothetical protein [Phycicoccus sp. Soil803]|uniref:hypothetical protein n=1 Tax=Phycicoccus sp. Soil803 TaxID=1736415 RepID=UPI000A65FEC8|nr:hypothetical protein [Phycicoccus sp. Soil803]
MSDIYGTTSTPEDATRELGTVDVSPASGTDSYGTDSHGTDSPIGSSPTSTSDLSNSDLSNSDTKQVAKDEALATGQQAKDGAQHVAEVGKDEAKKVVQETGQQAKQLWQQTRSELLDQSAQQQTRVAEGLRSLSRELSGMATSSEQQGVASDLAQQASQRMGDVAGWLDQRDPGSLVTEVKQFARQRPGTFLAAAALIGVVGGRLSRGLVADHHDQAAEDDQHVANAAAYSGTHTGTTGTTGTGTTGTTTGTGTTGGTSSAHTDTRPTAIADPDAFPA